jgi:FixJ family two-component response regulator
MCCSACSPTYSHQQRAPPSPAKCKSRRQRDCRCCLRDTSGYGEVPACHGQRFNRTVGAGGCDLFDCAIARVGNKDISTAVQCRPARSIEREAAAKRTNSGRLRDNTPRCNNLFDCVVAGVGNKNIADAVHRHPSSAETTDQSLQRTAIVRSLRSCRQAVDCSTQEQYHPCHKTAMHLE